MLVPRLRAPIVLVHGLLGFVRRRLGPWTLLEYFHGIPAALRSGGNRVLVPQLSKTGGIVTRAGQLKTFLDREAPNEPVHLIAHSLGGLDSRYLISRLGMPARVLSLTTIGTPHRGTPFADWGVRRFARLSLPLFDFIGAPRQAFFDLTTASCGRFNAEVPDASDVRYFSVAGKLTRSWKTPLWWLPGSIVDRAEGPNDGVVSVQSARWGECQEVWDADHLGEVNWPWPLAVRSCYDERIACYVSLVRRLADEGF